MVTPGRRELNKIQCRKRILKASRRLFTSKGYDSTTISDIAEASEISRATLYHYFPTKESLLIGIADAALDEARLLVCVGLRDEPSALIKLRRVLRLLATDSIRYLALTRQISYLNSIPSNSLSVTRKALMELLSGLVAQAVEQGELRGDIPQSEITEAMLSVYLMTQFAWGDMENYTENQCADRIDHTIDRMLQGLGPERRSHA